jgi:hypothetical protein
MMSDTKQQITDILNELLNPLVDIRTRLYVPDRKIAEVVEAIDRLVTEARMNELEMLPHKVFDCSPLIHLGYTFDEHTDRIAELQSQLNKEQK